MLIVAGGDVDREHVVRLARDADLIIAADSGLHVLRELGIEPSTVIGDFDSVTAEDLNSVPADRLIRDPSQDNTDLEKAIQRSLKSGGKAAEIVGATGGRLDHVCNAVSLLLRYNDQLRLTIHDPGGSATLENRSPLTINCRIGDHLSLIPAPAAYGLRSSGLRYPLNGLDLVLGGRDAISNEATSTTVQVTWRKGSFLLYRHRQGVSR